MTRDQYRHKWWALIGLSLLAFTGFLDVTITNVALPFIKSDLHANIIQLQWVQNAFTMLVSMFMIAAGGFGDRIGRRKVFYFGFVIFFIAAIGSATAPTIDALVFFRGLQGFAAAIIFTLGVALLPTAFPESEHTRAIGVYSAITGAGLALGPFLGGLLIQFLSWRWVFWVNIPIIVVGLACCSFSLSESKKQSNVTIDWLGLILLIIGVGCFVLGIIKGGQSNWSLMSLLFIVVGLAALIFLVPCELKHKHPLLDFTIFKHKYCQLGVLVTFTAGLITFVLMFFDPLFLSTIKQLAPWQIGLILFAIPLVQVFISLLLHKLINFMGIARLLVLAVIVGFICAILQQFFEVNSSMPFILLALVLMGITWGIGNGGIITAAAQSVPSHKMGGAIGTLFTIWNLAGTIFLAFASVLFQNHEHAGKSQMHSFMAGFHNVTLFVAALMLISVIASLIILIKNRSANTTPDTSNY